MCVQALPRRVQLGAFFVACLLILFGHPLCSVQLAFLSAFFGFALLWIALLEVKKPLSRFWIGFFVFAFAELCQLSWMLKIEYHGMYIVFVCIALSSIVGCSGGILTVFAKKTITFPQLMALVGWGVIMEWLRLFILCGYAWNMLGMRLTGSLYSLQLASVIGIFGLSFWVLLVNALVFYGYLHFSHARCFWCAGLATFPYLFGAWKLHCQPLAKASDFLRVAMVQNAVRPEERSYHMQYLERFISPYQQWKCFFTQLSHVDSEIDLVVLPEVAVPFDATAMVYCYREVAAALHLLVEPREMQALQKPPFAMQLKGDWYVNNLFLGQLFANRFNVDLVIGLDVEDRGRFYNSAFHFSKTKALTQYNKQILLPLAESLPVQALARLARKYGITSFFTPGKETGIFEGKKKYAPLICYEECFPRLGREAAKGANILLGLTNDVWFPSATLAWQHLLHARVRAVETGLPLLRACNFGVSASIDHQGRLRAYFASFDKRGIIVDKCYGGRPTLYRKWGDWILFICIAMISFAYLPCMRKRS